jgi:hypothetical protein
LGERESEGERRGEEKKQRDIYKVKESETAEEGERGGTEEEEREIYKE